MAAALRSSVPGFNYIARCARRILLSRGCASTTEETTKAENFDEMLRNSQFVKLGRPAGKKVVGKVTHIVQREKDKDVYVDFGWKFHAVDSFPLKR